MADAHPARAGAYETYNPWTVVHLVFTHLAEQGLHPVLGESGDPAPPARALLAAFGIEPSPEGDRRIRRDVHASLAQIRAAFEVRDPSAPDGPEPDDERPDAR